MHVFKFIGAAVVAASLVACGGGGGGSGVSDSNPLLKYEGTYYQCSRNQKTTISIAAFGLKSATMSFREETYSDTGCTGNVVGTYSLPQPASITYQSQKVVTLPEFNELPYTGAVDIISISTPNMSAQLTGTGVQGNCVIFDNGNSCYDTLNYSEATTNGGIYTNSQYLVTFNNSNNQLSADGILSKDASFTILDSSYSSASTTSSSNLSKDELMMAEAIKQASDNINAKLQSDIAYLKCIKNSFDPFRNC